MPFTKVLLKSSQLTDWTKGCNPIRASRASARCFIPWSGAIVLLNSFSSGSCNDRVNYTSQTRCICPIRQKSSRVHCGLYVCKQCGVLINADVAALRLGRMPIVYHALMNSGVIFGIESEGGEGCLGKR